MPAKSKKQFRFMKAAEKKGKVSKKVVEEFTEHAKYQDLPETVGKKLDEAKAKRKPAKRKGK